MRRFGGKLEAPFIEQEQRRGKSLVTPVSFDVILGATSTAIYTGKNNRSYLIRALAIVNDTAGAVTVTITGDGNQWFTQSIGVDSVVRVSDLEGLLLDPSVDLAGTGNGLRAVGWGLRVEGGDTWSL